jgi:hypothetical protein
VKAILAGIPVANKQTHWTLPTQNGHTGTYVSCSG